MLVLDATPTTTWSSYQHCFWPPWLDNFTMHLCPVWWLYIKRALKSLLIRKFMRHCSISLRIDFPPCLVMLVWKTCIRVVCIAPPQFLNQLIFFCAEYANDSCVMEFRTTFIISNLQPWFDWNLLKYVYVRKDLFCHCKYVEECNLCIIQGVFSWVNSCEISWIC